MALTGWTSDDYLERAAQVINTYPFLISAWVNVTNIGTYRTAAASGLITTNHRRAQLGAVDDKAFIQAFDESVLSSVETTSISMSTWVHITGEFISTTSRAVLQNGGGRVSSTESVNPSAADTFLIGLGTQLGDPMSSTDGVAEVSCWNCVGMTAGEMDSLSALLAAGDNPININAESAQPWTGKLVAYWPLTNTSTLTDASGNGHTLTMQGTLTNHGSHPTIDPTGPTPKTFTGTSNLNG